MLIVEAVEADSPAEQAGIQAGDSLLSYNGKPLPSPAALLALEENTFGVERVRLILARAGEHLEMTVTAGKLGIQTRPELCAEVLAEYEQGRKALKANEYVEAAECYGASANRTRANSLRVWLFTKAAEAWQKVPDWQKAQEAYASAWEGLPGEEDPATRSLIATGLGNSHRNGGNWEEAESWYMLAEHADGEAGSEMWQARSFNNLGNIAFQRGDLDTAESYHLRALQIEERLAPDSLDVAISLNNLGNVACRRGELEVTQEYYAHSLKLRERLAPDSLDVAASLNNLGVLAWQRGDLEAAQDYFSHALQIRERLAPDSLDVAQSLNNLGAVAWQRGDLEAAQDYFSRALQIRERLVTPGSLEVATSLNNLGNIARQRGDLQAAQDYYSRDLQITERLAPDSLDLATSLNNLGIVARLRGDLQAAQDYYTHALQIRERLAPDSLDVAASLGDLGSVARLRGDLQAARDYCTRDLQITQRLTPDSLEVAMSLNNLGIVASLSGDLASAHDYQTRALRIFERLAPVSLDCAETLTQLGLTLLLQQYAAQALRHLKQAVQIVEQQRSAIATAEARALLLAQHTQKYAGLLQCHLSLGNREAAFSTLERARARSLLDMLAERRLDFADQAPLRLLQQQQELDRQRAHTYDQLAKLSANLEDQPQIEVLHTTLRELQRRQQELTARVRASSPHYASLQYPQPLDHRAAQKALDPGMLLLSYLIDEERTFLFAVTRKTLQVFTLPVGVKSLQEHVQQFRKALDITSIESGLRQAVEQGKSLYDLLLARAEAQIKRAKRLLLCPDGPLHALPWPALVTKAGRTPRYLGQQKPLHTTLSMTIYAQTREKGRGTGESRQPHEQQTPQASSVAKEAGPPPAPVASRGEGRALGEEKSAAQPTGASIATGLTSQVLQSARRLLALGDPVYSKGLTPAFARSAGSPRKKQTGTEESDSAIHESAETQSQGRELAELCTRGLSLAPLPYSREEVESIGQLFAGQTTMRLGKEATKMAALTESSEADIVHFACHGWLDARDPLYSGLVLSQPEALGEAALEGDNGLLQAWEIISKMRLKADLVVLSACQTGLGQEVRGEGLIGLTRAFTYAGARSVLVSLWEVNDASTCAFMQAFYQQMKAGKGKAEALQAAIVQMSGHPKWRHPFFWSAFVLQGDGN